MVNCALRPDAQPFDEIRLKTVPRYKTSGLSGDEWRISVDIEFYRNGKLICTSSVSKMDYAVGYIFSRYHDAIDNGHAYFAGDGIHCDQEGCAEPYTVRYRVLNKYEGYSKIPLDTPSYRHFCDGHKRRGDCGLDDADNNYELCQ